MRIKIVRNDCVFISLSLSNIEVLPHKHQLCTLIFLKSGLSHLYLNNSWSKSYLHISFTALMSPLPLMQPPATMRSCLRKGSWFFREDFNTIAITSCSIPNISLSQQWLPSWMQCCRGVFAWVQEGMEQGRCFLHWSDSAEYFLSHSGHELCLIFQQCWIY